MHAFCRYETFSVAVGSIKVLRGRIGSAIISQAFVFLLRICRETIQCALLVDTLTAFLVQVPNFEVASSGDFYFLWNRFLMMLCLQVFVHFASVPDAVKAANTLNGSKFNGRTVSVRLS